MDEAISYDYLWQALQKEKQTNQLLLLPKTFYEDVEAFINSNRAKQGESSLGENAAKLLGEFFERRKQKILIYVAYNRTLPQPVSSSELEFYNKVLQITRAERLGAENSKGVQKPQLRSLRDIPEILLPSGNKFGPVKREQSVIMENEQDRIYLLDNAICEQV